MEFKKFIQQKQSESIFDSPPALVRRHDDQGNYIAQASAFLKILEEVKKLLFKTFANANLESDAPILNLPNPEPMFDKTNPQAEKFLAWVRSWWQRLGGTEEKRSVSFERRLRILRGASGTRGRAYFFPPIVVKVTKQNDEAEVAQIMKNHPDCGLTTLDVRWITAIGAYAIIHKFVNTKLPPDILTALKVIGEYVQENLRLKAPQMKFDQMPIKTAGQQAINSYSSSKRVDPKILANMQHYRPQIEAILQVIQNIYKTTGVIWHDVKSANFGHEEGRPFIVDPGNTTRYQTVSIPRIEQI